jgi:hypothetical protein
MCQEYLYQRPAWCLGFKNLLLVRDICLCLMNLHPAVSAPDQPTDVLQTTTPVYHPSSLSSTHLATHSPNPVLNSSNRSLITQCPQSKLNSSNLGKNLPINGNVSSAT